jgi:hypothetical protein
MYSKAWLWSGEDITILPIHRPIGKKLMQYRIFYLSAMVLEALTGFSGLADLWALTEVELELQL